MLYISLPRRHLQGQVHSSVFGRGGVAGANLCHPRTTADTASAAQDISAIKWVVNEMQTMV